MYSLRHVFWRGAMALSLLALGIGSIGVARPLPETADAAPAGCRADASAPAAPRLAAADRTEAAGVRG